MTMHLAHPSLSTFGKSKVKKKFRNADEARKARELEEEWKLNQDKWKAMSKLTGAKTPEKVVPSLAPPPGRETKRKIPSLNSSVTGAVTCHKPMQYTGSKLLGIGTLHKSNIVPIFSSEQAKDLSTMRRG